MDIQEVKDYIYLDADYEDAFIQELIDVSEIYINSMVGTRYKTDPKLLKLFNIVQKKLISDMYENRSSKVATSTKQDRIVTSILNALVLGGAKN